MDYLIRTTPLGIVWFAQTRSRLQRERRWKIISEGRVTHTWQMGVLGSSYSVGTYCYPEGARSLDQLISFHWHCSNTVGLHRTYSFYRSRQSLLCHRRHPLFADVDETNRRRTNDWSIFRSISSDSPISNYQKVHWPGQSARRSSSPVRYYRYSLE